MCNSTGTKPIFHCKMSCLPMPLSNTTKPYRTHNSFFPRNHASASIHCKELKFKCRNRYQDEAVDHPLTTSSACEVLGVEPNCSAAQLKAAFRARVKEFHPDLRKNRGDSDVMIRRVIQAYEMLSNNSRSEIIERECLDPFDNPECEASDVFVNEVMCVGQGCPYSCVKRAPHAFLFSSLGTARATTQVCYRALCRFSGSASSGVVPKKLYSLCYSITENYFRGIAR